METGGTQEPQPEFRPARMAKKSSPMPVYVALAVVVIAAVLGAAWYFVWSITPPEQVVKLYQKAQDARDLDTLAKYSLEKDRKNILSMKQAVAAMPKPNPADLPTYNVGQTTYNKEKASVSVTVTLPSQYAQMLGGMSQITAPIELVKEGRAWKVDSEATGRAQMQAFQKMAPSLGGTAPGGGSSLGQ